MTVVLDASVVIAALVGTDGSSTWAEEQLLAGRLAAPHLLPVEVASQLRRAVATGQISTDVGSLAMADLRDLPITYYDAASVLDRIWDLRGSVTTYDAWYVALAEALDAPLATLDLRLTRAPGPTCQFLTGEGSA
ncbi:type II toxin-antitoxin system VapC family toxin [Nocardioides sp. WS12]|uniref:type II toxin-antitoxin system VapC family toxin n=1 Tax=Nocardioides sp. WS12 TaxID=2486272 RepID=UPI0015FDB57A|nr:type II toxin-antitoxin system VapC family toxin [Nocardioides sp. WS12]